VETTTIDALVLEAQVIEVLEAVGGKAITASGVADLNNQLQNLKAKGLDLVPLAVIFTPHRSQNRRRDGVFLKVKGCLKSFSISLNFQIGSQ